MALVLVFVMLLLLVVLVVLLVVVVVLAVEEELLVQLVVLLLVVLELVVVVLELRVELVLLVALVVVRVVMEELLVEEELVVWLAVLPANRIDLSQALSPEASKPEILEALDLEIRLVGTEYIKHVHTKIYFTTFTLNNSDAPKSCICSTMFYFHFEILFNLPPMRPKILRK